MVGRMRSRMGWMEGVNVSGRDRSPDLIFSPSIDINRLPVPQLRQPWNQVV